MDPLQFCYWLQGFAELNSGTPPNEMQWKAIRDHLATVFNKVTPTYPSFDPDDWQKKFLKEIKTDPYTPPYTPPVWYKPNQSWTVTCQTANTQIGAIC